MQLKVLYLFSLFCILHQATSQNSLVYRSIGEQFSGDLGSVRDYPIPSEIQFTSFGQNTTRLAVLWGTRLRFFENKEGRLNITLSADHNPRCRKIRMHLANISVSDFGVYQVTRPFSCAASIPIQLNDTRQLVTGLEIDDVTAHTAALRWHQGYSGVYNITEYLQMRRVGGKWGQKKVVAGKKTHTTRVWGLTAETQYEFRVELLIHNASGVVLQRTKSEAVAGVTDALPKINFIEIRVTSNNVSCYWQQAGGDVTSILLCAQQKRSDDNCRYKFQRSEQTVNNAALRHFRVQLPEAAGGFWYRLSLQNGPDLLLNTHWISGGATSPENSASTSPRVVKPILAALCSILFVALFTLSVILLMRRRKRQRRKSRPAEPNPVGDGYKSKDTTYCNLSSVSGQASQYTDLETPKFPVSLPAKDTHHTYENDSRAKKAVHAEDGTYCEVSTK